MVGVDVVVSMAGDARPVSAVGGGGLVFVGRVVVSMAGDARPVSAVDGGGLVFGVGVAEA